MDAVFVGETKYIRAQVVIGEITRENTEIATLTERLRVAEEALEMMVRTQDEWETAVAKIIGKPPGVFNRAVEVGRDALALIRGEG